MNLYFSTTQPEICSIHQAHATLTHVDITVNELVNDEA